MGKFEESENLDEFLLEGSIDHGNKPQLQFVSNQSPSLEIDKHLTEETIFTNAAV